MSARHGAPVSDFRPYDESGTPTVEHYSPSRATRTRSDEQVETLARWIERHECGSLNRPASEAAAR